MVLTWIGIVVMVAVIVAWVLYEDRRLWGHVARIQARGAGVPRSRRPRSRRDRTPRGGLARGREITWQSSATRQIEFPPLQTHVKGFEIAMIVISIICIVVIARHHSSPRILATSSVRPSSAATPAGRPPGLGPARRRWWWGLFAICLVVAVAAASAARSGSPRRRRSSRRTRARGLPPAAHAGRLVRQGLNGRPVLGDLALDPGQERQRATSAWPSRGSTPTPASSWPSPTTPTRRRTRHERAAGRTAERRVMSASSPATAGSSSSSRSSSTCTASRTPSSCPRTISTTCSTDGAGSPASRRATSARVRTTPTSSPCPTCAATPPLPWKPGVARFACDVTVEGEEWPYCPRTILRHQLARADGTGLRVPHRRRARVLPRAPARGRHDRGRRRARHPRAALLRHARPHPQPRLRLRRSRATSPPWAGTTTRPTTRTPTASSSRTSSSTTRWSRATAPSSSATWSRRWRRSRG